MLNVTKTKDLGKAMGYGLFLLSGCHLRLVPEPMLSVPLVSVQQPLPGVYTKSIGHRSSVGGLGAGGGGGGG